jgi:hypothetical protein
MSHSFTKVHGMETRFQTTLPPLYPTLYMSFVWFQVQGCETWVLSRMSSGSHSLNPPMCQPAVLVRDIIRQGSLMLLSLTAGLLPDMPSWGEAALPITLGVRCSPPGLCQMNPCWALPAAPHSLLRRVLLRRVLLPHTHATTTSPPVDRQWTANESPQLRKWAANESLKLRKWTANES